VTRHHETTQQRAIARSSRLPWPQSKDARGRGRVAEGIPQRALTEHDGKRVLQAPPLPVTLTEYGYQQIFLRELKPKDGTWAPIGHRKMARPSVSSLGHRERRRRTACWPLWRRGSLAGLGSPKGQRRRQPMSLYLDRRLTNYRPFYGSLRARDRPGRTTSDMPGKHVIISMKAGEVNTVVNDIQG
jgi:hypothetical protein